MSNQAVGSVYQAIIDEVVNSSRVDFEESGVEESVLEELRKGWQQKLSQLDVARFPWDPKPDPPPQVQQAQQQQQQQTGVQQQNPQNHQNLPPVAIPQQHSQATFSPQLPQGLSLPNVAQQQQQQHQHQHQHQTQQQLPQQPQQPQNGIKTEPYIKTEPNLAIKQEPGLATTSLQQYPYNGMDNKNHVAAQRAAQHMQAQYGQRAASSINALHQQQAQQHQPHAQPHAQPQQPQHMAQQAMNAQQQAAYRQQMVANQQQQQRAALAATGQNHIRNGQTDGAADADEYEGVLLQRSAAGDLQELGRIEIDRIIHEQVAAKARAMEGGGLMLPLKEAAQQAATARRSAPASRDKGKQTAAYDGGDDDIIEDEDAINSDLDDPDEDRSDDDVEDEGLGHIMLCMYDKVQRVKNKWKCTLKDGVLTVNGKEYVFHKATGEYEW